MPRVSNEQIAQPYVGTPDEVLDNLNPVRTSAQLEDLTDDINNFDKYTGKRVWNSTTNRPVYAGDGSIIGVWFDSAGVLAHTPS